MPLAHHAALVTGSSQGIGHAIAPVFQPLGFDWQLTVGVLTSFLAREVFVSTMSVLAGGAGDSDEGVRARIHGMTRDDGWLFLSIGRRLERLAFQCMALHVAFHDGAKCGLGWLLATYAGGALLGSIVLSTHGAWIRPARTMVVAALLWFSLNLAFSWVRAVGWGAPLLFVTGFVQCFCMVPMAVILLRTADPAFRGRVMGVRMLAVYGLPMGLLLSGPLVEHLAMGAGTACLTWRAPTFSHTKVHSLSMAPNS